MPPVVNCNVHVSGLLSRDEFVSSILRPVLHYSPVNLESSISPELLIEGQVKSGCLDKFRDAVCVTVVNDLLVRKFVEFELLGDARFETALNRVTREIVRTGWISGLKENLRLRDPGACEAFELGPLESRHSASAPASRSSRRTADLPYRA